MRAIDTNVLVRLIARDDPTQVAAAESFVGPGAWVSVLALAEATWVLSTVYEMGAADLARAVEMLTEHRDLALQEPEAVGLALELFRLRPGLGFSDCLMLELARRSGHLPFGTFDRNLSKLDGAQKL
ncbi:MAG: type II toxin-antitoxin system VapC family toxin [Bryobacteraceae bacterium]|nr:type II toxin-antitoxin system VapC family toxin [Bryobacteraceae bacterium]